MYSVSVRDHFMIAHSFTGDVFGPARQLHGATYVVDLEFRAPDLSADNIVVDIGKATTVLREVLSRLNFRNLDAEPDFARQNTTTEFLARVIFDRTLEALDRGELGRARQAIDSLRITLHESHVATASFEGPANPRS